ncbi:MAG: nucleotide sugar dehydrogenase [Chloroflexi bacterium]|nr:nucleotide sugar dehydrogenase [Chloroflexota bacterium]
MRYDLDRAVVCVVGLGYVGWPLAEAFSQVMKVIGFDINPDKVNGRASNPNLSLTTDAAAIGQADFVIICVPTPVTSTREPDLSFIVSSAESVGINMRKGATVVLESTVFPGVTEDIMLPILERKSGLKCGQDFWVGYSPERINPGDEAHEIGKITKVVSGMDGETTETLSALYRRIAAGVFIARDIRTAEAAKVIENIQRDLNIALVNELAMIFEKMDLDINDVLDAAATKWNFQRYSPGMVGGHCIPVDPYYLVYKAREMGYHAQVILAGRAINDYMPRHIAGMTIKALNSAGKVIKGARALIMGLTYKENVPDTRESPVKSMVEELHEFGVEVFGYDPLLSHAGGEFDVTMVDGPEEVAGLDAVIVTVPHSAFKKISLGELKKSMNGNPVLIDVKQLFDRGQAEAEGFYYRTL